MYKKGAFCVYIARATELRTFSFNHSQKRNCHEKTQLCFLPHYSLVIPAFSVQEVMKEQDICLNCKYFHQKEDWRDTPGGIYMPNGECRCSKPGKDGYPKLHAGNHCFKFKRVKEDASTRKCGK